MDCLSGAPELPPPLRRRHQQHVNLELHASCVYLPMSFYLDQDDVTLERCSLYFLRQSHEKREHAQKLIMLQNPRGRPHLPS
ncbi:hypothetical protein H8958_010566 [Nasalis larvatus]